MAGEEGVKRQLGSEGRRGWAGRPECQGATWRGARQGGRGLPLSSLGAGAAAQEEGEGAEVVEGTAC